MDNRDISLNTILIFSENEELILFCKESLASHYQIDIIKCFLPHLTADIVVIDTNKTTPNKTLLSQFNQNNIRCLILGEQWSDKQQIEAFVHGAAGYCNKSISKQLLLQAVEFILKGDVWIQRHLVSKIIGSLVQINSTAVETDLEQQKPDRANLLLTLSNRELDVAKRISLGDSNKAIASSLSISERTVKAHLTSIFKKTHVRDRLHLALFIKDFN